MSAPYVWIQTRDGSPTLWNNELSESFRSVKGAFTESWLAFVQPALERASKRTQPAQVGEFGLGAGTNWLLWTLGSRALGLHSSDYCAIERDSTSFELGRAKWFEQAALVARFLRERGISIDEQGVRATLETMPRPVIFLSIEEAVASGRRFDIWFHDPFGFEVNPEGYSAETLRRCSELWAPDFWGGSYACNRRFRETLESLGCASVDVVPTGDPLLKRERIEFARAEAR